MSTQNRPGRMGIGIIGAGRVGPVIGSALRAAGHTIVGMTASTNNPDRASALLPGIPTVDADQLVRRCELVIIALPDDAIGPVVEGLAQVGAWSGGQLVVHTCGAHGTEILTPAARAGALTMAIHPAMTFTGTSLDLVRLEGCPVAVTASNTLLPIAQALAVEIGGEPITIVQEGRPMYHAALSHGANHLVTLVSQTLDMLRCAGVTDPAQLARPLLQAALEQSLADGDGALTGPVSRGDAGTIHVHLQELSKAEAPQDAGDTYRVLAQATLDRCIARNALTAAQVRAVQEELG